MESCMSIGLSTQLVHGITSTRRLKNLHSLSSQGLALIGPLKRLGHGSVRIVDEGKDFGL